MEKIQNILKFAMRMEKDAGDFYNYYADVAKSESTKELFRELAEIEKTHFSTLKEKFDELGLEEPPVSISWVVDNTSTTVDPHILSNNSDLSNENDSDDIAIIRMAYLIESDFALFYKNAVAQVNDENVKKLLQELSDWENGHKDMFYKRYQELLKKHWGDIASIILP